MIVQQPKIDISQAYVIVADVISNQWRNLPVKELKQAVEKDKNVLLVDWITKRSSLYPAFFLDDLVSEVDDEDYKTMVLPWNEEDEWVVKDPYTFQLMRKLHWSFYNELSTYMHTDEFKRILRTVKLTRDTTEVFPASEDMLVSLLMDLRKVRGVWVGLSPYPNHHSNGIAFSTYQKVKPPSLQVLEQGIRDSCGYGFLWNGLHNDLVELTNSGILLLNTALTTTAADPRSHVQLWNPFIQQIIKVLCSKPDINWILFGKDAQELRKYITNSTHTVYTTYHPAYHARNNTSMVTDAFKHFFSNLNINLNV